MGAGDADRAGRDLAIGDTITGLAHLLQALQHFNSSLAQPNRTEVGEIARLLITHHVKRVPVVRDGQVVGIVSRVDLLRAIAGNTLKPTLEGGGTRPSMAIPGARRGSPRMRPPRKPGDPTP